MSEFGWDLMIKTVECDIKSKEDVLVVVIHWMLIKRGFKCLGVGTEKTLSSSDVPRETLPSDWNADEKTVLRYLYKNNIYTLHRMTSQDNVIFNLVNVTDLSTSNVTIDANSVTQSCGPLENILSNHNEVIHKIKSQLIEPVTDKATRESETQTDRSRSPEQRSSISMPPFLPHGISSPLRVDPRGVGSVDLNPFGNPFGIGSGGGMLFDPFRGGPQPPINPGLGTIGGLPSGSIPPGARFDPIGPSVPGPIPRPRPDPDADHLPPPGYEDMFM